MLTMNADGSVTFRVYAPRAECVELLADFTGWVHGLLVMQREEGEELGWWRVSADPPAGDHAFCYLVDGRCWMPDYAAHGVTRNEYGNLVSLVTVPARAGGCESAETHAINAVVHGEPLRESWKIDGCCAARVPWAG
jgi:hypothetical protein